MILPAGYKSFSKELENFFFNTVLVMLILASAVCSTMPVPFLSEIHIDFFFASSFICLFYLGTPALPYLIIVSFWEDIIWQMPLGGNASLILLQFLFIHFIKRFGKSRVFLYHYALFSLAQGITFPVLQHYYFQQHHHSFSFLLIESLVTIACYPLLVRCWIGFLKVWKRLPRGKA